MGSTGRVNKLYLLQRLEQLAHPLDYYVSGLQQLIDIGDGHGIAAWVIQTATAVAKALTIGTDPSEQPKYAHQTLEVLGRAPRGNLELAQAPGIAATLRKLASGEEQEMREAMSRLLIGFCEAPDICDTSRGSLIVLTSLAIILGDIGRAFFQSKYSGTEADFKNELEAALAENAATWDTLLNTYYMFGLCGDFMLAGHKVSLCGTASAAAGGPDFKVTPRCCSEEFQFEAQRRDPLVPRTEYQAVWDALSARSRLKKMDGRKNEAWIFCVDITATSPAETTISLDPQLAQPGQFGFLYPLHADAEFLLRVTAAQDGDTSAQDWISAAVPRLQALEASGTCIAGALITRNQFLKLDSQGASQAGGAYLIVLKKYERLVPWGVASRCYSI